MIRILLYLNILNMIVGNYYSKYFNYKYREKINLLLTKETNEKKKIKIYAHYNLNIRSFDSLSMILAFILGIIFYNLNILQIDIIDQIELIVWKKVINYILLGLWAISLIYIGFYLESRELKKDENTYNIKFPHSYFDRAIRTKGISTIFLTFINIIDILIYNFFINSTSILYIVSFLLFIIFLLLMQFIKKNDTLFKKQKFLKTTITLIALIVLALIIDYIFI